jgi:hypothetical protein
LDSRPAPRYGTVDDQSKPYYGGDRRQHLRAADIMPNGYDPKEYAVNFLVDRVRFLAAQEGEIEVLRVLPLCLKGDALKWYTGLNKYTKIAMSTSLERWVEELQNEYTPNQIKSLSKARALKYRFNNEDLPLSTYITRKTNLMKAAGYYNN